MPRGNTEGSIALCPQCGGENLPFASFCILCGEPLDGGSDAGFHDIPPQEKAPRPRTLTSRGLLRLESALGLIILVAALAYAIYTWRVSTARSEAYRDGVAAALKRDWDDAAAGFKDAGDYLDALRRNDDARTKIKERDRLYYKGVLAQKEWQWKAAISAYEQTLSIQPGFLDTQSRLTESRDAAVREGLADIVYLVGSGPDPGLYLRDSQGRSNLLPGSDARGTLRAFSSDGKAFVYDRPASRDSGATGRVAVLALRDDQKLLTVVPLPQLDAAGTGVFAENGLWWHGPQAGSQPLGGNVSYVSLYDTGAVARVTAPELGTGRRVVAFDPPRSRVILAATGAGPGSQEESRLYIDDATVRSPRLLLVTPGEVARASVSESGDWLLLEIQRSTPLFERSVLLVRLEPPRSGANVDSLDIPEVRVLDTATGLSPNHSTTGVSAIFLPNLGRGGYPPRVGDYVLLSRIEGDYEQLTLHDLQANTRVNVWSGRSDVAVRGGLSTISDDGSYLATRQYQRNGSALGLAGVQPGSRTWSTLNLPEPVTQIARVQFAPGNEAGQDYYLVAHAPNRGALGADGTVSVYSAQVLRNGILNAAKLIATALSPGDGAPTTSLSHNALVLAYVSPTNELRTVFFDGTHDTRIAAGVKALWSLKPTRDVTWSR